MSINLDREIPVMLNFPLSCVVSVLEMVSLRFVSQVLAAKSVHCSRSCGVKSLF